MQTLTEYLPNAINSLAHHELAALARIIIEAAIAGDFLALKFILESELRVAESERFSALRVALGFPSQSSEDAIGAAAKG